MGSSFFGTCTLRHEQRLTAQAVWCAGHDVDWPGATASAAFHAFRPKVFSQLDKPQPTPSEEVVIRGAKRPDNLGRGVVEYERPRTVRLGILLEDYLDRYRRTQRSLAAYELGDGDQLIRRTGYLVEDTPRQTGRYLANLQKEEGEKRDCWLSQPMQAPTKEPWLTQTQFLPLRRE